MGFHDLISASEAAALSGVSIATLQRFADVGYLTIDSDADGVPLFSKAELNSVFGLTIESTHAANNAKPKNSDNVPPLSTRVSTSSSQNISTQNAIHTEGAHSSLNPRMQSLFELLGRSGPTAFGVSEKESTLHEARASAPSAVTPHVGFSPLPHSAPSPQLHTTSVGAHPYAFSVTAIRNESQPSIEEPAPLRHEPLVAQLEAENRRLRHVLDLQEKILTLRESEIRDLKEQRDWLRQRLERLEEKSDRDQLLLLSETQTIRKLIALNEPKKSTFQLALEWLGIRPALPEGKEGTIELRPSAARVRAENAQTTAASGNTRKEPSTAARGAGQFNSSQVNPSQGNPSQFNPSQFNPSQGPKASGQTRTNAPEKAKSEPARNRAA